MRASQQYKQIKKPVGEKKKRKPDKARRDYDDRLAGLNESIRTLMKNRLGESTPTCPTCKSQNAKSMSPRRGVLVGIKESFRCGNCKRTYVMENDSFRNVWLKLQAMRAATFGDARSIGPAMDMLYDYGVNAEYSSTYRWLKSKVRA